MQLTVTDYTLAAAHAAHLHLVRLHTELTEKIVLEWLRTNRKHPAAPAVDADFTLYRLYDSPEHLRNAIECVTFHTERTLP